MQRADVPEGNHNPNGYSEEEILRTLRAEDGSRKVSFWYEHLDPKLNRIKIFDNIIEGSVEMQYISEIKRTASFKMRDGGEIDFHNDHIRPWFRLHMPPRWTEQREISNQAWYNRFSGSDAGEDVTPSLSEMFGSRISEVTGNPDGVQFNRVRRIASTSSIRMGHEDHGTSFRSSGVNFDTGDRLWRGYFYVEPGGHFELSWVDTEGDPLGVLSLVLDDDGPFSLQLGDDTITDVELRDSVVGSWIKVEAALDSATSTVQFRLFWSDLTSFTPDLERTSDVPSGLTEAVSFEVSCPALSEGSRVYVGPIEFGDRRVIPSRPNPTDNDFVEWPLGTFLMSTPVRVIDANNSVTREIDAYDRTKMLVDDKLTERMVVEKGKNYTDLLNELLKDYPRVIEPSTWVCGRTREFDVGTSMKEVVDMIAESIDYHTVRLDPMGRIVLQPYVSPDDRTPEFHYEDNEISIMQDDVEVEFDTFEIANVWIVSLSEVEGDPLYVKLENHDPANPFSIPRRGRKIVDFREEEEGFDPASLNRKAKRIQFEANRQFENISFNTLLNPLHDANDCYTIRFHHLGISNKYTEINWEMPLKAGASMSHTCRRNVNIDPELFDGFVEDELTIKGSFTAGNMDWGIAQVVPTPNKPTKFTVTGLDLQGTGKVHVFVTPWSSSTSMKGVSTYRRKRDSFEIWLYRTTSSTTLVSWLAVRDI